MKAHAWAPDGEGVKVELISWSGTKGAGIVAHGEYDGFTTILFKELRSTPARWSPHTSHNSH